MTPSGDSEMSYSSAAGEAPDQLCAAGRLALSGARNPYPGNLGVIEEGALADLLVIEGNPLERIEVLENPHDNLRVIVKDGVVCKNTP